MEEESDFSQIDRARRFWASEDLDSVFSQIQTQLSILKTALKTKYASDKEWVQSLKLLEALDWPVSVAQEALDWPVPVAQVSSDDELSSSASPPTSPPASVAPDAVSEGPLPPVTPVQYRFHCCNKSCVPIFSSMPQSLLWAQNPLSVPLIYGFHRSNRTDQSEQRPEQADQSEEGCVIYTAPCGLCLHNYDDMMDFLTKTETYNFLQLDLFSFNLSVSLTPGPNPDPESPVGLGPDLSRGQEQTPVELCGPSGERPLEFRYRRDRWPRGCFLSRGELFQTHCDCRGHCGDRRCACVATTTGEGYTHNRLQRPTKTGIYECGPWCGCDPDLCQNRVVQRGLRVRLQVFQSPVQDWGVRCRDDLDQGTFICVYAGVVLQRDDTQVEDPPPKQKRAELPSDDDVELITEWLPGPSPGPSPGPDPGPEGSAPTHVPVIQRGADKIQAVLLGGPPLPELLGSGSDRATVNGTKRTKASEDFYLLDASKEGNVSRFFNHSCDPTLFVQNVFTDSHDVRFPNIAFFTKRALKAGTELTWDYSSVLSQVVDSDGHEVDGQEVDRDGQEVEAGEQEVPCLCRSTVCQRSFFLTELKNLGAS